MGQKDYLCKMMERLIETLLEADCSLVLYNHGVMRTFGKKGIRDLIWLLDNEPESLRGARLADKVVGKAAAALMARGGVTQVYAHVMSRQAIGLLEAAGIAYSYGQLVERIIIAQGDTRCPLEQIVAPAQTAEQAEHLLRRHFARMQTAAPVTRNS